MIEIPRSTVLYNVLLKPVSWRWWCSFIYIRSFSILFLSNVALLSLLLSCIYLLVFDFSFIKYDFVAFNRAQFKFRSLSISFLASSSFSLLHSLSVAIGLLSITKVHIMFPDLDLSIILFTKVFADGEYAITVLFHVNIFQGFITLKPTFKKLYTISDMHKYTRFKPKKAS